MNAVIDLLLGWARQVPEGLAVAGPIVVPILAAGFCLLLRAPRLQRTIGFATLALVQAGTVLLAVRVDADGPIAVQAGGWSAPFGISLVADRLAALLAMVSAAVLLVVYAYAVGQVRADSRRGRSSPVRFVFTPTYLALAAGVCFSFLTGDLFNLFVAFEVMLISSYVLLTLNAGPEAVRSTMTYIVVSLLASALFVASCGLVYAVAGTVNFAHLHDALADVPGGVRLALALILMVVFGIKAALFPLYFWLPDSYPLTPAPVTAVFAGLLTKVGVYAIMRSQLVVFPDDTGVTGPVLLTLAGLTLVFGILGSIAQQEIKRVLSFTIVSHIGFMVLGLGLFSIAGVAGAIFYIVHHIVTQTTLFCVEGLIERRTGTSSLQRISGLATVSPALALMFALPALSLAGFPPLSGFVGKVALLQAGVAQGSWAIVTTAVVVSLLTVYAVARIWVKAFWGAPSPALADSDPDDDLDVGAGVAGTPLLMTWATVAAVVLGLAIPIYGGPLYHLCERAAADLVDPRPYLSAVFDG